MPPFNDTVIAPALQTNGGDAVLTGGNGGILRLFHPDLKTPHIELVGNQTAPENENTGGGLVNITNGGGEPSIQLNGHAGTVSAIALQSTTGDVVMTGGNGGIVRLFHPGDRNRPHVELIANENVPERNTGGGIINVTNGGGEATIQLNGQAGTISAVTVSVTGDIVLSQADCAEDFDISTGHSAQPGSVMVIDDDGALRECNTAYDCRVVGVVSGAGDYKPAIRLDAQPAAANTRTPIALTGKVYCKVDAAYHSVAAGDLLVSSPTPAHAMKATDATRAFGAVIGKALRGIERGRGLIPMLVSLQ